MKKNAPYKKLDWSISSQQQRQKIVQKIVDDTPAELLTSQCLEELASYLTQTQKTKKDKTILTDNRLVTVNKRETSYEGFVSKLEGGEDSFFNFIGGGKEVFLTQKGKITDEDCQQIPQLQRWRESIKKIQKKQSEATGPRKASLTKQLIQMRKDQYVIKQAFKPTITPTKTIKQITRPNTADEHIIIKDGLPISDSPFSLFSPQTVKKILLNYQQLEAAAAHDAESDIYDLMDQLKTIITETFKDTPVLQDLLTCKICGYSNQETSDYLLQKHNTTYSLQYISALWRRKIPQKISEQAKKQYLFWHYTFKEKGQWKRCSRCGEVKLAHPYFFTRNRTSKDGFYSLCKECRRKREKEVKK